MTQYEIPSDAQIQAAVGRGRRLQSKAFVSFLEAIASMFTSGSRTTTHTAYGNAAR